jgi:hypothetical protein
MVRFEKGAVAGRMKAMGVGTGQLRDRTGLTSVAIQAVLHTDTAPDDVAEVLVKYLGKGLVVGGPAEKKPAAKATGKEEGVDLSGMTAAQVLVAVDAGEFTAAAAWEREQEAETPRKVLLRELQARVKAA